MLESAWARLRKPLEAIAEGFTRPLQAADVQAFVDAYARHIVALLQARDPLSERVHLSKAQFALYGLCAVIINSFRRIGRARPARKPQDAQRKA